MQTSGRFLSAINLAAVPHALDCHDQHRIINRVNNAVISQPHPISVVAALQFPATRWAWIGRKIVRGAQHTLLNYRIKSARFDRMFEPREYSRLRKDLFRTHFQYLMASQRPVDNDWFQLTCGPRPLDVA